jgi:trimeric autotransporter adhesin
MWRLVPCTALVLAWGVPEYAQTPQTSQTPQAQLPCVIAGLVQSGGVALPGVAIAALTPEGQEPLTSTSTEANGSYTLRVPAPGTYMVRATLAAFAVDSHSATLSLPDCSTRLDFTLVLASRAARAAGSTPSNAGQPSQRLTTGAAVPTEAARGRGQSPAAANGRGANGRGGFQQLDVVANANAGDTTGSEVTSEGLRSELQLPPGFSTDAPTETLSTTATQQTQSNDMLLFGGRGGRGEFGEDGPNGRGGGPGGDQFGFGGRGGGPGGAGFGPGGGGPGGGGPGGPGGFGGMRGGGGRVQGTGNYNLGGSMFDAAPYPLNGRVRTQPEYVQQRYGAAIGGPLTIPHVYKGGTRTSFFFNYNGNNSRTPVDQYSTVPTLAARAGDFSRASTVVIDPATGEPFPGNQIPQPRISPAAETLLAFIPEPNLLGDTQNFHYVTATSTNSHDINLRLTHIFGAQPQRGQGGGRGGGFGGGGGRGGPGGGAGAFGRGGRGPAQPRSVLNVNLGYRQSSSVASSTFPTVGGSSDTKGWNVPVSWMYAKGRFNNMANVSYNRNRSASTNLYAFNTNVVGAAGINGVSTDPFDWGIPTLSFTTIADLRDRTPARRVDQRFQVTDTMMHIFGRHAVRWGGEFRYLRLDSLSNSNPRGSFVFTGLYTSALANGHAVAGTGLDFADFLLGDAQQASVQYGPGDLNMRGNAWSVFLQDDWRVRGNLTLNYGVRYEYASPYYEINNHLVNLDVNSDFTAAVPVIAGGVGEFSGPVPTSLVRPDRNNFAPRVGLAWRPRQGTIVRTGFGINYNLGAYGTIAQKLAAQPPFAVSNTSLGTAFGPLPLADAFADTDSSTTTNSFGIIPDYNLGAAHIWNLDVQRDLPGNVTVSLGYTGTHGTTLDMLRAPNRNPDGGLRIDGVQPFLWESSEGRSTLHSISLRARKRLSRGVSFGGAYSWSHAYDNASSFGTGGGTVAQNDQDLHAEWGRSSFERRQTLSIDSVVELPWGTGRRWLTTASLASQLFGGWSWSTDFAAQSGAPFTARVVGNFVDVASGVNGTLRADYSGAPIYLDDPTTMRFFNTDAFSIPGPGLFGNAPRNFIIGPGSHNLNMNLSKNVNFNRARGMTIRVQATNVLNSVQFSAIDTVVNSPTFGQVTSVRPMRSIQLGLRFRF